MSLLKQIGQGYVYLSSYECKQALSAFSSLATHHYNTGWVLTQVGRAHFELAEYRQVWMSYHVDNLPASPYIKRKSPKKLDPY